MLAAEVERVLRVCFELSLVVDLELEYELALSRLVNLAHVSLQTVFGLYRVRNPIHIVHLQFSLCLRVEVVCCVVFVYSNCRLLLLWALNGQHGDQLNCCFLLLVSLRVDDLVSSLTQG